MNAKTTPPPIYIITGPSGKDKVQKLSGDIEFNTPVLTTKDLQAYFDNGTIKGVETVLEAPILASEILRDLETVVRSYVKKFLNLK